MALAGFGPSVDTAGGEPLEKAWEKLVGSAYFGSKSRISPNQIGILNLVSSLP